MCLRGRECAVYVLALAVAGAPAACARAAARELPASALPTARPIETDRREYEPRLTESFVEFDIALRYTNRTGTPVYIPTCHGTVPPAMERLGDGGWARFYAPIWPACRGIPVVVAAGSTYTYVYRVRAGRPGTRFYPAFDLTQLPGTFRLAWRLYEARTTAGPRVERGELLPLEERVSNEFRIARPR